LLSQEVHFRIGGMHFPWNFILTALQWYESLSQSAGWLDGGNLSVMGKATPWRRRGTDIKSGMDPEGRPFEYAPPSLTELLLETSPFECSDSRDKVYALLGLTSWASYRKKFPAELEPDYALPIDQCMQNATLAAIGEKASLECLVLPIWTRQDQIWPSWVVPWYKLEVGRNRQSHLNIPNDVTRYPWMPDCSQGHKVNIENLRQPNSPDSLFLEGGI
jgi:hypothetical protein